MTSQIVKSLFSRRLDFKRSAEADAQAAELDMLDKDTEFARLSMRYKALVLESAKIAAEFKLLEIDLNSTSLLKKAEDELEAYKKSMGYDFSPRYKCKQCSDTLLNGSERCSCIKNEIKQATLDACGIMAINRHRFNESDLTVVKDEQHRSKLELLYTKYSNFAYRHKTKAIGYKPHNAMFVGSAGLGKTFLMECICSDCNDKGLVALYFKAFELNNYFLKIAKADSSDFKAMWDLLLKADVLFIDDLGTEPILSKITLESLFNLIDYRHTYSKPFFISSNLSIAEIMERYKERLASRLFDTEKTDAYIFEGYDLRIHRGEKND